MITLVYNVKKCIHRNVKLIEFKTNLDKKPKKTLFERLDDKFSGLYGASWTTRKKNEQEVMYWKILLSKMTNEELSKAVTSLQQCPSPFPTYAPKPLEFQALGHIVVEKFAGECCFKLSDKKQCRSHINVRSFYDKGIDKRYCSAHYPHSNNEESEIEKELRSAGLSMFDFIMINVAESGVVIPIKKTYTEEQRQIAIKLKNRDKKTDDEKIRQSNDKKNITKQL